MTTRPSAPGVARAPAPTPRGRCSGALLAILSGGPTETREVDGGEIEAWRREVDRALAAEGPLGDDVQLTLYLLYALHLHGLAGVDDAWEWHPALVAGAGAIERAFEVELRRRAAELGVRVGLDDGTELRAALVALTEADVGPATSTYIRNDANRAQVREFLVIKSIYQLKEADPHTFALPRLGGRAKSAAVEIQGDEYGNGSLRAMHSELFRVTMRAAGLDDRMGAYVDAVPAAVLANDNAAVMFGLHRRLRAAALGHLCALEMTSSAPMRRYAQGLRRVGLPDDSAEYFLEHVGVDAVHEQVALHGMALPLVAEAPELRADLLLGAATATFLDGDVATEVVSAWRAARSALREPLP